MMWLAFKAMGWAGRIATVLAIVASLGTIYGIWHYKIWSRGYARAIADIAAEDTGAINAATQKRSTFLDCRSRGLRWDTGTGECKGR